MDTQDLGNHHLQVAAEHIAEACTNAFLIETDQGTTELHIFRGRERLGAFEHDTYLCELLRELVELEERPFRFEVDGTTYIGWAAIGRFIEAENQRQGLLPLGDISIEVTDSDGHVSTVTGIDLLHTLMQAGVLKAGPHQEGSTIRLT